MAVDRAAYLALQAKAMSEAELQSQVLDIARMYGWRIHHSRPAQERSGKWSTPLTGDAGLPDLILAHHSQRRLLFRELKSQKGKLSDEQEAWIATLAAAVVDVGVWRPIDLLDGTVAKDLARPSPS